MSHGVAFCGVEKVREDLRTDRWKGMIARHGPNWVMLHPVAVGSPHATFCFVFFDV